MIVAEELRDEDVCTNLVAASGVPGLKVAAVSRFLDKAGYPLWQQSAIFSTLPVVESGSLPWQSERHVDMPRGFVFAVLDSGEGLVACFGVHLKANVSLRGEVFETQKNIYKREFASMQILENLRELRRRCGGHPGCAFDYVLCRGFGNVRARRIGDGKAISDRRPVTVRLAMRRNWAPLQSRGDCDTIISVIITKAQQKGRRK